MDQAEKKKKVLKIGGKFEFVWCVGAALQFRKISVCGLSERWGPRGGASDREGGGSSLCADVIFLFLGFFFLGNANAKVLPQ